MNNNAIYKEAFKHFLMIAVTIAMGRLTYGAFFVIMVILGCLCAFTRRFAYALSVVIFLFFISVLNSFILPRNPLITLTIKFGPLVVGLCLLVMGGKARNKAKLPLGMLFVYLVFASISSLYGYAPFISFLKLTQFALFLLIVYCGTRSLSNDRNEMFKIRAFILALAVFISVGSILLYPFPQYSTLGGLTIASAQGAFQDVDKILQIKQHELELFCGITYQSQTLAGVMSCACVWVICDMLFVEQRLRYPHMLLIGLMPIVVFMTRSRMGLLVLGVTGLVVLFYAMRKISLPLNVRRRVNSLALGLAILASLGAIALELHNNSMSRWLRKVEDVDDDKRSLSEAVTNSRMGLLEENLFDFRRSPIIGSGFQVAYWHQWIDDKKGLILSAPIEKGLLPVMVLGETGVIGAIVFFVFIVTFISGCARQRLYVSLTLFWALFASNIGEATFFSLGGPGGIEWMFTIVGGFVIDLIIQNQSRCGIIYPLPNIPRYWR